MPRTRFFAAFLTCFFVTPFLRADCVKDYRSNKRGGVLITDITIIGTQSLDSDELAAITSELTGTCLDEDPDEQGEVVRAPFQNRGYFGVEVKNLHLKPGDPMAVPKPAALEAEVLEGPRYRLAEIKFTGNHSFSADELRSKFPLKKGDLFSREKVANGLDSLRQVYVSNGFIDFTCIPNTENSSDATVDLSIAVMEGSQYHVGKVKLFTKKELAETLRAEWELPEGAVFDLTYLDKYIDRNQSLLPSGFQRSHVQIVRDCPNATVEIRLPLDAMDPRSQSPTKDSPCESADNNSR
jgi:outer membrane protein assembly factor BamA